MVANSPTETNTEANDLHQKAYQRLLQGDYHQAENLYEQAIKAEPHNKLLYWYLGLMLLLQEKETEAQTIWFLGMAEGEPEQVELWTAELLQVLQLEAERRGALGDCAVAWAIRQHMKEIYPADINNLLHLVGLHTLLKTYTGEEFRELGVFEILKEEAPIEVNFELLMQVLKNVLDYAPLHPSSVEFAELCIAHITEPKVFVEILITSSLTVVTDVPRLAIPILELGLRFDAEQLSKWNHLTILHLLAACYQNTHQYDRGIELSQLCYSLSEDLADKIFSNYKILRGLMGAGGYWEEVCSVSARHQSLLELLVEQQPRDLIQSKILGLFPATFYLPYIKDDPCPNRKIHNEVAKLCQANIEIYASDRVKKYQKQNLSAIGAGLEKQHLKIGYLSHCLKAHSVGWLARWLFKHHDRKQFKIYSYLINKQDRLVSDWLEDWYKEQVDRAYVGGLSTSEIADQINEDGIDILIDLDSLTLDLTCEILAMKPAAIQATWLGWDACGLPAVDYFIADPYVLPESAQKYYQEKIWRLPQTYIAVDGFEVEVPTLRREDLNIPSNAVVYLSSQVGHKRHPDTARMQMKIIAEVPNSYFLIKGAGDENTLKTLFFQLAEEEGVERDRVQFLSPDPTEATHRANLGIADVVLDTYPYNGATTTLETLWMCIPLVTRVGEQFAARNSYTMMVNAGVTEGIAWTDEEYVEWGIRLGKDTALREKISGKLLQSRKTAPLWNGKQFALEMEKAYEQMWQMYVEKHL
jgi:predicted O-linked N-acetylglucosamine transferase (SPINDLY family)